MSSEKRNLNTNNKELIIENTLKNFQSLNNLIESFAERKIKSFLKLL